MIIWDGENFDDWIVPPEYVCRVAERIILSDNKLFCLVLRMKFKRYNVVSIPQLSSLFNTTYVAEYSKCMFTRRSLEMNIYTTLYSEIYLILKKCVF